MIGLALLLIGNAPAAADFILSIEDSPEFSPNSAASIGVFIRSTEAAGEDFGSFNVGIAFDFAGIDDAMPLITTPLFLNTSNFGPVGMADYAIAGDIVPNNFTVFDTNQKLFDLNFEIGGSVPAGSYPLTFVNGFNEVGRGDGTMLTIQSFESGALNVAAVPEPGAFAALTLATVGMAGLRRRKRA
tara:strand:- start:158372 stop:158929 length:558 start_codon:yes stop_codon:yes gene_type:complete